MKQYKKELGKVSVSAEGKWNIDNAYERISMVFDEHTEQAFISKCDVPAGIDLYNREYWMPLNVSGYSDSNIIILNKKINDSKIKSYSLEEAIKSIKPVGRKPGCILVFYNSNSERLDIGGCWEIWQFNDTNIYNWENIKSWQSIYYNYNKFVGWYSNEENLKKYNPFPEVGCYAYVGSELNNSVVFRCDSKYVWTRTKETAKDYVKVILDGTITIGENGNWYQNGKDTNIPASVKGDDGKTPFIRNINNILEYSYDEIEWKPISEQIAAWFRWKAGDADKHHIGNIQISRDNVTWQNLSGDIVSSLHISKHIGINEQLPTNVAEGTIIAKRTSSTNTTSYELFVYAYNESNILAWISHGTFTSISVGLTQETGNNENVVMSQKAVTENLNVINDNIGISEYPAFSPAADYAVGDVVKYEGRLYRFTAEHAQGEWIGTDVESWSEKKEKEDKSLTVKRSINLFNQNSIIEGQGVSNVGLVEHSASYKNWATSGYIPVKGDTDYHLSIQGNRARTITYILFDKNKNKVDYLHAPDTYSAVIHTTADAAFIMFNVKAYGQYNTKVMLTEGSEKIDYVSYNTLEIEEINMLSTNLDKIDEEKSSLLITETDFGNINNWEKEYFINDGILTYNNQSLLYKDKIPLIASQSITAYVNLDKLATTSARYANLFITSYDINDEYLREDRFTIANSSNNTKLFNFENLLKDIPKASYIRISLLLSIPDVTAVELEQGDIVISNIKTYKNANITTIEGSYEERITDNTNRLRDIEEFEVKVNSALKNESFPKMEFTLESEKTFGFYNANNTLINVSENYYGHTVGIDGYESVRVENAEVFVSGHLLYILLDENKEAITHAVKKEGGKTNFEIEVKDTQIKYIRFNSRTSGTQPIIYGTKRDFNLDGGKIKDASIGKEKLNFDLDSKEIEITVANSDKIGIIGDSYTESAYAIKGKSYISKLSLFSDYQFVNFGKSGDIYAGRIADIRNKVPIYGTVPYDEQKTKYTMMCCYTNDIKYMSNSQYFKSLENAIKAIMGIGSIPIVCTEYHTNFSAKDKSQIRTGIIDIAKKYRLECWDIAQIVDLLYTTRYEPFWGGSHMGTRTNAMEADNYEKFLNNLESPMQSIKIFNARSISDSYDDYMFTSNEERAKLFKEINVGAADLKNATNVDAIPNSPTQKNNSDYQNLMKGAAITLGKVALVSVVLPAFSSDINKLVLSLDCSKAKVLIKDSMEPPYPSVDKLSSFYVNPVIGPSAGDKYRCAEDGKEYTVVSSLIDEAGDYHLLCTPFVSSGFATTGTLNKISGASDDVLSYTFREMGINPSNITEDTVGHWVELADGGNGNYDISNLVDRCVDVDKCHFLIVSESGNLTLNDVKVKAEIVKEKNVYRPEAYKFESTYNSDAEELLPASTFGEAGVVDTNWNVTPTKIYEDIQGVKSYPKDCSSVVKVTDSTTLKCTISGSKLKTGLAKLEIWCRYFPEIYTDGSGNQITENSYDYNDIIVEIGGQETTLTQRVNTYWKIVEFNVYTVKGSNLYLKIHSNNEGIEVARLSMKYI